MTMFIQKIIFVASLVLIMSFGAMSQSTISNLQQVGDKMQLIVDGEPFIVLGGELGNSSFTSVEYMEPHWNTLKAMNVNTILAPVYWELIEPREGVYDFSLLDDLLIKTRQHDMKIVLLWFGSWKNSMSSHIPAWVKQDVNKYPRAVDEKGVSQEILSPFCEQNLQADRNAFSMLMKHIRQVDESYQTVIMVQPENEIGMLPSARDYHPIANKLYYDQVPDELMHYLVDCKANLVPEFLDVWRTNGYKTKGTWEEVFGTGYRTDELFMAWHFSLYTEQVVKAGKNEYPLPMFVNAALIRPGKIPGEYPSAGPLPHLLDIWRAGAPSIDMFSPDYYNPDFEYWNDLYTRQGNPLFIPEHRFDHTVGAKALFAIGHYEALGFSPFSIEDGINNELSGAYDLISQIKHLLAEYCGVNRIDGVLLDKEKNQTTVVLGDYELLFKNSYSLGWEAGASNDVWDYGGAIIIQTDENEFIIAGSGVVTTFKNWKNRKLNVGILSCEEGVFDKDVWRVSRYLNGDQTHQGRHVRIAHGNYSIQKVRLYNYE